MTETKPPATAVPARSSGVVVPHGVDRRGRVVAALIYGLIRTVDATLRYELDDPSASLERAVTGPAIFTVWHNRLAMSLMVHRRFVLRTRPQRRLAALVSASRDGGLLARVLEHFGVEPVRGSSSRRGAQAILELTSWAERGYDLALTPDGPRGPAEVVQDGVVALAQHTRLPIIPVSTTLQWCFRSRSWDRFQVPLPFSRCRVRVGPCIQVPRELADEQREQYRLQVQAGMDELSR